MYTEIQIKLRGEWKTWDFFETPKDSNELVDRINQEIEKYDGYQIRFINKEF